MAQMWDSLIRLFEDLLTWIAARTGDDYGLAIIVVTLLVRVILWPLAHSQISNMRRMQAIQPELQRLQKKYKSDRQKLTEETMRLMRENRANPAAGCLPTLLQVPVLWALFLALRHLPEISGRPFLWMPDLSKPDPYYVIPFLAGALTFLQSWMTTPRSLSPDNPAAGTQRTMLYVLPVLFFFLCLRYPAGFGLYWVASSALAVLQYWVAFRVELPLVGASDGEAPGPPRGGRGDGGPGGRGGGGRRAGDKGGQGRGAGRQPPPKGRAEKAVADGRAGAAGGRRGGTDRDGAMPGLDRRVKVKRGAKERGGPRPGEGGGDAR